MDPKQQQYAYGYDQQPAAPLPPAYAPGYTQQIQQQQVGPTYIQQVQGAYPQQIQGGVVYAQQPSGMVGYVQQQVVGPQGQQIIVVSAPPTVVMGLPVRRPAGEVFKERIKTLYGVSRLLQAVMSLVILGLCCGMIAWDPHYTGYYWSWIIIIPISSFATALSQLFNYSTRSWAYGGCPDIGYAILYIFQAGCIAGIYYAYFEWDGDIHWIPYYGPATSIVNACYAFCGIMSLFYWIVGCSACCCHCLDFNMPPQ